MATRISPFPNYQPSVPVQNGASLPKQEEAIPPTSKPQDEQARLKAVFEALEKAYSDTMNKTCDYRDVKRAHLENCAAYAQLVDFAEKHPELECTLPPHPIAATSPFSDECSIS